MKQLAYAEFDDARAAVAALEEELKVLLVPRDPNDTRNVIVEIRAGTGGDEAALFASDLFRMYSRFAEKRGWKVEVLDASDTGLGGMKEISFGLSGNEVYGTMKFESGVHRVQRVPETEAQGRVHTSAATVAILPEVEQFDVEINPVDLDIDTFRSGGEGRAERQQGRDRRPDHAPAVRDRRGLPSGTFAVAEPRTCDEDAAGEAL